MKFKIGDIVIANRIKDNSAIKLGYKGRIIECRGGDYLVEFDKYIRGHNGHEAIGKDGHCWYIGEIYLTLFESKPKEIKQYGIGNWVKNYYK